MAKEKKDKTAAAAAADVPTKDEGKVKKADKKEKKAKAVKEELVEAVEAAEATAAAADEEDFKYDLTNVSPIAEPLASAKLSKSLLKTVHKVASQKLLKRGVKEVVKALRKGEKGLVLIAGDISPIDVITHIPVMCEDAGVTYCYVPSKEQLGTSASTRRPTSIVMIPAPGGKKSAAVDYAAEFKKSVEEISAIPTRS